jgi:hypothetical protein
MDVFIDAPEFEEGTNSYGFAVNNSNSIPLDVQIYVECASLVP